MSSEDKSDVRVRYAPSPTGIPHVGNIRTALFDYFQAKANNGKFILRIEDTDQARKTDGAIDAIKDSLKWLGAEWDEYVVQSERLDKYEKYALELVEKGQAIEEEGAIRFLVGDRNGEISWEDAVGKRKISFQKNEVDDFIILKKDGYPTYHLANVVDDHLMGITHVIRGDDWISSTPKHILLYKAFGWEMPIFAHVPNVMGEDGKKLSKRRGAKSVLEFKNEGYLPEALLNYLMLLGWSPKDDKTILNKDEIAQEFALSRVSVAGAIFSQQKLEWMNGEYIRMLSNEDLKNRLLEFDGALKNYDRDLVSKLVEPAKTRIKTLGDFKKMILPFIEKKASNSNSLRDELYKKFSRLDSWNKDEIILLLKEFIKEHSTNFPALYELVIGEKQGLPLGDVFEILGKNRTLSLLK